jgi:transcriptional regulator with XRE-family HTH domain
MQSSNRNQPPPNPPPSPLARRLDKLIKERGTTARALSLQAGLGPDGIRNIMRGLSRSPQAHTVQAIADALEVPLTRLLTDEDAPPYRPEDEPPPGMLNVPEFVWGSEDAQHTWRIPLSMVAPRVWQGSGLGIFVLDDGERALADFGRPEPEPGRPNTFVVNNGSEYVLHTGKPGPEVEIVARVLAMWQWV